MIFKSIFNAQVGKYLAERRKKAGITQAQMAEQLGLETETISRMENGKITLSLDRLQQCADILECTPADLLRPMPANHSEILTAIANIVTPLKEKEQKLILKLLYDVSSMLKKL